MGRAKVAIFGGGVGVFWVGPASADGFDLGAGKYHSRLHAVFEEVIVPGRPIDGRVSFARGDRIALRILRLIGFGLMSVLAGHENNRFESASRSKFLC